MFELRPTLLINA